MRIISMQAFIVVVGFFGKKQKSTDPRQDGNESANQEPTSALKYLVHDTLSGMRIPGRQIGFPFNNYRSLDIETDNTI